MSHSLELRKEISHLRGKACRQVIKAASKNDAWSMKRYAAINSYFANLMSVKTCSKAISTYGLGHGKSPCFLQVAFLRLGGPDYPLLILPYVDGAENMECAL